MLCRAYRDKAGHSTSWFYVQLSVLQAHFGFESPTLIHLAPVDLNDAAEDAVCDLSASTTHLNRKPILFGTARKADRVGTLGRLHGLSCNLQSG